MQSILSRLRTRVVSDSSRHSHQAGLPLPTTATTVTTPSEDPINELPPIQESVPVSRKIYPDLDLLPDDLTADPTTIRHGLPPPVRRGLSGPSNLHTPTAEPTRRADASSAPSAEGDADSPTKASRSSGSSDHTTPSGGGFIERFGNWSTFGRRRAPPPSLNEFGEKISPSPSAWRTRRSTNSRLSSRPSSKTTSTHSSPHENKETTPRLSSQSSFGRRTPAATAAARSNSHKQRQISTPNARELGFDSPRTLGHPDTEVAAPQSPPPPLPPSDHPALHPRARTMATFPPRARSAGAKNNDGVAQDHFTFGKSLRPYRSLPRVQHIFRTRSNKSGEESNERSGDDAMAGVTGGDQGRVPVPTMTSWPSTRPINVLSQSLRPPTHLSPSSSSFSSSSSSSNTPVPISVGHVDAHDPIAPNLYDPSISLSGNVVRMQQDAPRVRDKKPLRSSLKASARPSPLPIASASSSNTGVSALMPSFSLVAAAATASDSAPPHTPVTSHTRTENGKGKRKAEDVDTTPPDAKKATFVEPGAFHVFFLLECFLLLRHATPTKLTIALPPASRTTASPRDRTSSLAPSSFFHHNKRARLSGPSPSPAPSNTNAHNSGTYSSRTSSRARAPSSTRSGPHDNASERERRYSHSQRSIPISALVTPQVPSMGRPSSAYHMRDPRRPPRRMETSWALRLRTAEEEGSPVHAWLFYLAPVLFPLWWVGAVWRVPQTRVVGGTDTEKAVPLDDPQIEFGACF